MMCELVERDIDAYVDRELDRDAEAVVRGHVEGCIQIGNSVTNVIVRLALGNARSQRQDRLSAFESLNLRFSAPGCL